MKKTLCFTLTLFTFVTLTFMTNSFAQDATPEYMVRVIYFLPNDRIVRPDIDENLDKKIKEAQLYFANQLEAHGFERKSFSIETDRFGKAVVHHVVGQHGDSYYQTANGSNNAITEISQKFDMSRNIYYIVLDISSNFLNGGRAIGIGSGNSIEGLALVTAKALFLEEEPEVPHLTVHELGHAFGLLHDVRKNYEANRIYTLKNFFDPMTTTFCAAEWLDNHRYFNQLRGEFNTDTIFELHPIEFVEHPSKVRLRITITDPDGLHQVQLFHRAWFSFSDCDLSEMTLKSCQKLSGNHVIAEFVTDDLIQHTPIDLSANPPEVNPNDELLFVNSIMLMVLDAYGNITTRHFDIDIREILSLDKHVPIPDKNLAAAIRESLGLSSNDPITNRQILRLYKLDAVDRNIKSVEGIENAVNLWDLNFLYNQIEDIKPISKLPHLQLLNIHGNRISDISSLKGMPLASLNIARNPISDITVLPSLKRLQNFYLQRNPVNDLSPVWELTSYLSGISDNPGLRGLHISLMEFHDLSSITKLTGLTNLILDGNGISDITPLSNLKNLSTLILWRNKITDTSPLVNLTNLKRLELQENPITNRKPLLDLLRKNPDVQIYLKWGGNPLPVTLSHFRAEHTDAGVILKWTTESEVDNAGFYIYRSETKDSEFKVINPTMIQGAGTTGERNDYTWTDTTAKPNTVYYYRIEDVSHAGVREQLATVRLRGLVSARGKLTTIWADMKTQISLPK